MTAVLKTNDVQENLSVTTNPIILHVFSDVVTPNQAPSIEFFSGDFEIDEKETTIVNIGKPTDQEGSTVYVKSWLAVDIPPIPWVTFLNDTNNEINFRFEPPEDAEITNFDLLITLAESDSKEQLESLFKVNVKVNKEEVNNLFAPPEIEEDDEKAQ